MSMDSMQFLNEHQPEYISLHKLLAEIICVCMRVCVCVCVCVCVGGGD
jgi:hypothetical protein